MSSAKILHHQAIDKLRDAETALESEEFELYSSLLNQALMLETEAAYTLRDKLHAEPTRSVLFRSAATLALRCKEFKKAEQLVLTALIGEVPFEIKTELLDVFGKALSGNTDNLPRLSLMYADQDYTSSLRARSVNFKVASKGKHLGTAVRIDHAIGVMRSVRGSYINYMGASYKRSYGHEIRNDKYERILKQSISDELLIADLKQASFGFSISVDSIMAQDITVSVAEWKLKTFEAFKQEVIYFDYNSPEKAIELSEKYSVDELRAIYGPIVSMLQESNGFVVSLTNQGFVEVQKVLRPINKSISSLIVPKVVKEESDLKLYQALGMAEEGDAIRKDNILNMEEIQYMEFTRTTETIRFGKESLFFKEPYSIKIEYNSGVFLIEANDFGFQVESNSHKEIFLNFSEQLIETFKRLKRVNVDDLTIDERQVLDRFNELINFSSTE